MLSLNFTLHKWVHLRKSPDRDIASSGLGKCLRRWAEFCPGFDLSTLVKVKLWLIRPYNLVVRVFWCSLRAIRTSDRKAPKACDTVIPALRRLFRMLQTVVLGSFLTALTMLLLLFSPAYPLDYTFTGGFLSTLGHSRMAAGAMANVSSLTINTKITRKHRVQIIAWIINVIIHTRALKWFDLLCSPFQSLGLIAISSTVPRVSPVLLKVSSWSYPRVLPCRCWLGVRLWVSA